MGLPRGQVALALSASGQRVLNPLLFGIIGAVVAIAMLVTEIAGYSWFTLQLTSTCGLPLWMLFATYAALQFTVWHGSRRRVELSDAEVAEWGPKLEQVTPTILSMYAAQTHVRDIAKHLERSHGIPPDITLRYIVALARHVRDHQNDDKGTAP